jgi:hypothetical protein
VLKWFMGNELERQWKEMTMATIECSPNIICMMKSRKMRKLIRTTCTGKLSNAYKILKGKTEGMRPLRMPTRRWEENIKTHPKGRGKGKVVVVLN